MPALRNLQRAFAAALNGDSAEAERWVADDGIPAAARLGVYRNNARVLFEQAVQLTFPVVQRRVGGDYFRQLLHHFRAAFPSRAGDLHETGRPFAGFLAQHLANTPYLWLSELAALEWAVADSAIAADITPASAASLEGLDPESLATVHFEFVPSLRLVSATVPVLAVWKANQSDMASVTAPVDLASGPDHVVLHRAVAGVELRGVTQVEFQFIAALHEGATLEEAVSGVGLPLEMLPVVLQWLFADGLISAVRTTDLTKVARPQMDPTTESSIPELS
jgi:hypothetical protein